MTKTNVSAPCARTEKRAAGEHERPSRSNVPQGGVGGCHLRQAVELVRVVLQDAIKAPGCGGHGVRAQGHTVPRVVDRVGGLDRPQLRLGKVVLVAQLVHGVALQAG